MLVGWKHMIGKIRTLGAGWLLLCGTWTHQAAHAQSRSDLIGGKLTLSAGARGSVSESYLGRVDLSLPRLFGDRAFVKLSTLHRNVSEMAYYGPGPDSQKSGRSNYRLEDTNVELRPGF